MLSAIEKTPQSAQPKPFRHLWVALREPLMIFLVNRLGLILLVYLSLVMIPVGLPPGVWRAYPENLVLDGWFRWDSGWYARIAQHGYNNAPNAYCQRDTAFFPLYPLLVMATSRC